jgi:2'-5' RNA ligase
MFPKGKSLWERFLSGCPRLGERLFGAAVFLGAGRKFGGLHLKWLSRCCEKNCLKSDCIRSFLAIDLGRFYSEELNRVLGILRRNALDAKWIEPERAHITLKFFGAISREAADTIIEKLDKSFSGHKAFKITLGNFGAFPNLSHPRVLWLAIRDEKHDLDTLKLELDRSLEPIGIPRDVQPFKPHLTLGRLRRRPDQAILPVKELYGFSAEREFYVDRLVLFRSDFVKVRPRYTPLHNFPLQRHD